VSNFLPRGTQLGQLHLGDIFAFHDVPRLFLCHNEGGTSFLTVWVEEGDADDRWLYAPCSRIRLSQLRAGELSVRRAFAEPEGGWVFEVVTPHGPGPATTTAVEAANISPEDLPETDTRLSVVVRARLRMTGPNAMPFATRSLASVPVQVTHHGVIGPVAPAY
jgi:hypothetical protein